MDQGMFSWLFCENHKLLRLGIRVIIISHNYIKNLTCGIRAHGLGTFDFPLKRLLYVSLLWYQIFYKRIKFIDYIFNCYGKILSIFL